MKQSLATVVLLLLLYSPGSVTVTAYAAESVRCLECHYHLPFPNSSITFIEGIKITCSRCHEAYHEVNGRTSHPVDLIPSMPVPRDMPLDIKGNMTCITCHTFHIGHDVKGAENKSFLRRTKGKAFCYSCHKKPLFR